MMYAAIRDIDALTPETAAKCRLFLERSKTDLILQSLKVGGVDIFVTETRRTSERHAWLWSFGRTLPGVKRTWTTHSKHQDGLAFDIAFKGGDLYPSDVRLWARLGSIGKACGLTWGGDFKGVDSVHFENNGGSMRGDKSFEDGGAVDAPVVKAETAAVAAPAPAEKVSKLPTLKSAKAAAAVSIFLMLLPSIASVVPQIAPFVGAINAVASLFGYGV